MVILVICVYIMVLIPMYLNWSYLWRSLYIHSSLATLLLEVHAKQNSWQHKLIMLNYTLDLGNADSLYMDSYGELFLGPSTLPFCPSSQPSVSALTPLLLSPHRSSSLSKAPVLLLLSHISSIHDLSLHVLLHCNDQPVQPCPLQMHSLTDGQDWDLFINCIPTVYLSAWPIMMLYIFWSSQ